jgi:hypothetical protein
MAAKKAQPKTPVKSTKPDAKKEFESTVVKKTKTRKPGISSSELMKMMGQSIASKAS